jgi:hypothetical protein
MLHISLFPVYSFSVYEFYDLFVSCKQLIFGNETGVFETYSNITALL